MQQSAGQAVGYGKVILFGEHAVVYGRRALALSTGPGCVATARLATPEAVDRLRLWPFGVEVRLEPPAVGEGEGFQVGPVVEQELRLSFATAFADLPAPRPPLDVEARLLLPSGAGLGSSAALSVAVARAIDQTLGRTRDGEALLAASLRWERVCHGNPSGVDSALAVYGGAVEFRRGEPAVGLGALSIPPLLVAHGGPAPSTRLMVERVADHHRRDRRWAEGLFDAIDGLTVAGKEALLTGDLPQLGRLMVENQRLLVQLELSTSRLNDLCEFALVHGALGAKLTGGGGGGCMIALCPDQATATRLCALMNERGADAFILEGTL